MMFRNFDDSGPPGHKPRFEPGTLVWHRRYNYRAVVVALDSSCQAPSNWYASNTTQPDQDQPWYHLLVHGSAQTTYAAEQNLEEDLSGQAVEHPLVKYFFKSFKDGKYDRNDELWPSW